MWFEARFHLLLVLLIASPSLQGRRHKRQDVDRLKLEHEEKLATLGAERRCLLTTIEVLEADLQSLRAEVKTMSAQERQSQAAADLFSLADVLSCDDPLPAATPPTTATPAHIPASTPAVYQQDAMDLAKVLRYASKQCDDRGALVDCCPGSNSNVCKTPRNIEGVCINIKDCPEHLDYLVNRRKDPEIVQYLRDAVCRREGSQIITCCPVKKNVNFGNEADCTTPRNAPGQCINIKQCPVLLEMLQQRREPGWRDYLLRSQCGTKENNVVKVCCPSSNTGSGSGSNPSSLNADNGLPNESVCGLSDAAANRVVNGRPAVLGAWPWMAALGYSSPSKPLDWLCGGSLISSQHVLTAAHCLVGIGRRKLTTVRLGDLNLNDSIADRASPIDIPVDKTIVHENYDGGAHTVDIALIKLRDRVEFTKLIRPICIPTQSIFPQDMTGYSPFVIGWGAIGYRGPSTTALQEAQIDITDLNFCANAYKSIKGATIDSRVICALSAVGKDACQGDSGGPLILPKRSNFYLIGLVSYGYKCAEPGYPGVYTKVSLYMDWITKNMRS